MHLSAYSQRIPGMTVYTPVSQLGVQQWPGLAGLGDTTGTVSTVQLPAGVSGAWGSIKQMISDNPAPVALLIAALLFK